MDNSESRRVGLLIVHGIGNQAKGAISEILKRALQQITQPNLVESERFKPVHWSKRAINAKPVFSTVLIGNTEVNIAEGHWADLSDPDNPPAINSHTDIAANMQALIRAVWLFATYGAYLSPSNWGKVPSYLAASQLLLMPWALFVTDIAWSSGSRDFMDYWQDITRVSVAVCGIYAGLYSWSDSSRSGIHRRLCRTLLNLLRGFFVAPLGVLAFLLFWAALLASLVYYASWVILCPYRWAGQLFQSHLPTVAVWTNRLAWSAIVLPAQIALQLVKSISNLLVIFTSLELPVKVKAVAVARMPLLIMALGPLLAIWAVISAGHGAIAGLAFCGAFANWCPPQYHLNGLTLFLSIVWELLIIVVLSKTFLPVVDLILDIGNYHLADSTRRKAIQDRVEEGYRMLKNLGCSEIHVLSHSLGSVISYDWLQSRSKSAMPIASFHTIGSPIDKFWYIDYSARHTDQEGKEAGISVPTWVNYWSPKDVISGPINHIDPVQTEMRNVRCLSLGPLFVSHVYYWTNKAVLQSLYRSLTKVTG